MDEAEELRRLVQGFVRGFGLLAENQTPCGKPMPTSQAHALMILLERHDRSDPPTQSELTRALGLDKSSVARLCTRLHESGHVTRTPCPKDGRAWRLCLTDSGVRLARSIDTSSRGRFTELLSAIPEGKRGTILDAIGALNDAVHCTRKGK